MSAGRFWKQGSQAATPSLALLSSDAAEGTVVRPRAWAPALGQAGQGRTVAGKGTNPEGACGPRLCGQPGVSSKIDLKPPAPRFINFTVSHLLFTEVHCSLYCFLSSTWFEFCLLFFGFLQVDTESLTFIPFFPSQSAPRAPNFPLSTDVPQP